MTNEGDDGWGQQKKQAAVQFHKMRRIQAEGKIGLHVLCRPCALADKSRFLMSRYILAKKNPALGWATGEKNVVLVIFIAFLIQRARPDRGNVRFRFG